MQKKKVTQRYIIFITLCHKKAILMFCEIVLLIEIFIA